MSYKFVLGLHRLISLGLTDRNAYLLWYSIWPSLGTLRPLERRCVGARTVSSPVREILTYLLADFTAPRVAATEMWFIYRSDWEDAVEDAKKRNMMA